MYFGDPRIPFHETLPAAILRRKIQAISAKPEGVWGATSHQKKVVRPPRPSPFPGRFLVRFYDCECGCEEGLRGEGGRAHILDDPHVEPTSLTRNTYPLSDGELAIREPTAGSRHPSSTQAHL